MSESDQFAQTAMPGQENGDLSGIASGVKPDAAAALPLEVWADTQSRARQRAATSQTSGLDTTGPTGLSGSIASAEVTRSKEPVAAGQNFPVKGIDLYQGDGVVDFDKVKNAGYQFVIPRAAYGTKPDAGYVNNIKSAEAAGLKVGAYCFFRPSQDVDKQAQVCADNVKAAGGFAAGDIGVVADFENEKAFKNIPRAEREAQLKTVMAEWKALPQATRLGLVRQYLDDIQAKTGQQPLIYGSSKFFTKAFFGDLTPLGKYDLWVADYIKGNKPEVPDPWNTGNGWTLWQTTPKGQVPGQTSKADIDVFNGSQAAFEKHFGEVQ